MELWGEERGKWGGVSSRATSQPLHRSHHSEFHGHGWLLCLHELLPFGGPCEALDWGHTLASGDQAPLSQGFSSGIPGADS